MNTYTGDGADGHMWTRARTAVAVAAGTVTALAMVGVAWWQGWRVPVLLGWVSVKVGAKVAFFVGAGGLGALTVWLRGRRKPPAVPPASEEPR
ncbi:hypothetical protein ACFU5O_31850 [Streptomyces sp. NPDC057445]|uniref:hypothetical protein n=1 Tax=Streptomyces sp. NPDC057445 TaxID=3346136 RepID=UPI00369678A7